MTRDQAYHTILRIAHELAAQPLAPVERSRELAKSLLAARDRIQLDDPPPIQVVTPAPRTVCLHCGKPYEEVS